VTTFQFFPSCCKVEFKVPVPAREVAAAFNSFPVAATGSGKTTAAQKIIDYTFNSFPVAAAPRRAATTPRGWRPFNSFPVAAPLTISSSLRTSKLSILSQLLRAPASPSRRALRRRGFQFFPSCCGDPWDRFACVIANLSILSQLLLDEEDWAEGGRARVFQFFPSCCERLDHLVALQADADLSILSQLLQGVLHKTSQREPTYSFNSFPVAA